MMLSWLFSDPLPVGADAPDFSVADDSGRNGDALRAARHATSCWSSIRATIRRAAPNNSASSATTGARRLPSASRSSASIRKTPGNHANFRKKFKFPFPLLVDERQKIAQAYHANGLIVKRTVYLIGRDGKILFARRGMPSPGEVLAAAK